MLAVGYWLLVFDHLIIKTTNNFDFQYATSEAIQPSTSEAIQLSTSEAIQPSTSEAIQLSTSEAIQLSTERSDLAIQHHRHHQHKHIGVCII
jgi:hypothetical protein